MTQGENGEFEPEMIPDTSESLIGRKYMVFPLDWDTDRERFGIVKIIGEGIYGRKLAPGGPDGDEVSVTVFDVDGTEVDGSDCLAIPIEDWLEIVEYEELGRTALLQITASDYQDYLRRGTY